MSTNLKTRLSEDDWKRIVQNIYARKCVPFLGAAVNRQCADEPGLMVGAEVAAELLERMVKPRPQHQSSAVGHKSLTKYRDDARQASNSLTALLEEAKDSHDEAAEKLFKQILQILPDDEAKLAHVIADEALDQYPDLTRVALQDLARVAQHYKRRVTLLEFDGDLKEIIPDHERQPARLLRTLSNMPLRLIVTTNYDRLMERALELINPSDLIDSGHLGEFVMARQTSLSKFIFDWIPNELFESLEGAPVGEFGSAIPSELWADKLNDLIQQTRIYLLDEPHKADPASDLLQQRPSDNDTVRKNRIFLERSIPTALKTLQRPYSLIVQPIGGFGPEENRIRNELAASEDLILFKLHGTFTDGPLNRETRPVITEEDYIEFLAFSGGDKIDKLITAEITNGMLLFLGYSLEDWNFRALFKGLIEIVDPDLRLTSFAIQKDPPEYWVRFWEDKQVRIFNVDICDFAEELEVRYQAYKKAKQQEEDAKKAEAMRRKAGREERRIRSGRQS